MRIDVSRVDAYTGIEPPKLSFGQKLGRFCGKALGVLGPIGAAVMSVTGVGLLPAAALYGTSSFAGNLAARAESKDAAAMQAAQNEQARMPITMPGLFEQPNTVANQPDFVIPSSFERPVDTALKNGETARIQNVEGFQFY